MNTSFKFPEIVIHVSDEGVASICDTKGNTLLRVLDGDMVAIERLVQCWNACRKLYSSANHIEATEDYVKRLETLRKDAWARVQELEAELATHKLVSA